MSDDGTRRPRAAALPPRRRLLLAAVAVVAGLLALVTVWTASGRLSVAGAVLVGLGLVTGVAARRDLRRRP